MGDSSRRSGRVRVILRVISRLPGNRWGVFDPGRNDWRRCIRGGASIDGRGVSRIDNLGNVCGWVCADADVDTNAGVDADGGAGAGADAGAGGTGDGAAGASSIESPGLPTTVPSSSSKKVPAQLRTGFGEVGSGEIFSLFCC